ncbi:MAG TPA: DEAD/DEAH box helicase, partial [Polyangiaceae bacterium]
MNASPMTSAAPLVSDISSDLSPRLEPELAAAIAEKGFTRLTKVQEAVLAPELQDRDLRISSQTGSGKTVAIGLSLRHVLLGPSPDGTDTRARALVIVPTRELAAQVRDELSWLYSKVRLRIATVTGGASYREEHRALARGPRVIVGTPGRLLDHLTRGAIDPSAIGTVVLDEADRMLDLGFREELEAILKALPSGHRTHLVSATFARDVTALADRVQSNAARVEGTPLGSANADIDHVLYLIDPRERVDALINVLLERPDDQTLIFARTRADVSEVTLELQRAGFAAGALTGEMEQASRVRTLAAFKNGELRLLVATDVAARGIDVQDVSRVVQLEPPSSPDPYTHRSGRTGRAGRKGTSIVLVP